MTEREQALQIAKRWLDFEMNPLVQMVPGDPDCDACVLARQFTRIVDALERIALLDEADGHELTAQHALKAVGIASNELGKHPSEIFAEREAREERR